MTVLEAPTRQLHLEVAHNVRHLGGYSTKIGLLTRSDIVRSASLHALTRDGIQDLAEAGIRAVVDLRSTLERESFPTPDLAPFGIRFVHTPVFEQDASPVGQAAEEFPGFPTVYRDLLERGRGAYRSLFQLLADEPGGVLFHCAAGKDRTGLAAMLVLDLAGVPGELIVTDYARSAALLTPLLGEWLPRMRKRGMGDDQAYALMASNEEDMEDTLAYLYGRWGGADGYLEDIGLSFDLIGAVRARLAA
jgi:protein-tyrosine phosphatase